MSSWPNLTYRQTVALAKFIHELRGDWDEPGLVDQISKAAIMASAPAVAIAAIKAAASAKNRTPAVIPLDGEHWRVTAADAKPVRRHYERHELCQVCNNPEPRCRQLSALPNDGHPFTPDVRLEHHDVGLVNPATGEVRPPAPTDQLVQLRDVLNTRRSA